VEVYDPDEMEQTQYPRREFIHRVGGTAILATIATAGTTDTARATASTDVTFNANPFTVGIASGDPLPDSVVLWTRLAPKPLTADGGMPDRDVPVTWQVATDETMKDIVTSGVATARPELAHSVHVDLRGLEPDTEYFYRFKAGATRSPVGRTQTAPASNADVEEFTFAFASCQHYPTGYYTAYDHLADEDLDVVVQLGDYIYEDGLEISHLGRGHEPPHEIQTLSDYRIRHAQYKTDQHLQDAHAAFPWIVTWDDHEVVNNYADEDHPSAPPDQFLARRANAYQAYYEHQPLRPSRLPEGPDLPLYRRFRFGELAEFNVLDTRQYRDDQTNSTEEAYGVDRTILGDQQEQWLMDGLETSTTRWNILAQQVPFAATDENPAPGVENFGAGDKWDGYRADRDTLLDLMTKNIDSLNPIVITGDVHRNFVYNLKADFTDPESATVGTEYVGTSITSFGDGTGATTYGENPNDPWQQFMNDNRGYVRCTITPEQWRTDYRIVSTVERPNATVSTKASFITEAGDPGAKRISERFALDQA
jgi:alkaline phosphatase D